MPIAKEYGKMNIWFVRLVYYRLRTTWEIFQVYDHFFSFASQLLNSITILWNSVSQTPKFYYLNAFALSAVFWLIFPKNANRDNRLHLSYYLSFNLITILQFSYSSSLWFRGTVSSNFMFRFIIAKKLIYVVYLICVLYEFKTWHICLFATSC